MVRTERFHYLRKMVLDCFVEGFDYDPKVGKAWLSVVDAVAGEVLPREACEVITECLFRELLGTDGNYHPDEEPLQVVIEFDVDGVYESDTYGIDEIDFRKLNNIRIVYGYDDKTIVPKTDEQQRIFDSLQDQIVEYEE